MYTRPITQYVASYSHTTGDSLKTPSWTYTSTEYSTLNVAGIQVCLFTDVNCTVQIQQSLTNGVSANWDIVDTFNCYANTGFGVTVQAVSSYVRVVVTSASLTSTVFRFNLVLCPIVEAVPRSLDESGNFRVGVRSISDEYGFGVENTPMGEMRTVIPSRISGAAFDGSGNAGAVDANFWTATAISTGGTPTCVQASGRVTLSTAGAASNGYHLSSKRRARYVSGSSMGYRATVTVSAGATGNTRRWGVGYGASWPTVADGAWFQLAGTTFTLELAGGTAGAVHIANGTFNGTLGATWSPTAGAATVYEIYWTNSKVYFVVGDEVLHTYSSGNDTWSSTMSLYVFADNQNAAGGSTACTLASRVMSIRRLGQLMTQPTGAFINDTNAHVLKYGPGNLHRVVVTGDATGNLKIYDALSATNQIGQVTSINNNVGVSVDFGGIPFFTGLTVQATTGGSYTVVYE